MLFVRSYKVVKHRWLGFLFVAAIACHAQQGQPERSSPSLNDTLQSLRNTFPESQTLTAQRAGDKRELTFSDCAATIRQEWATHGPSVRRETIFDLSLIDPQSIQSYAGDLGSEKRIGIVTMTASNEKKVITATEENALTKARIGKPFSSEHLWLYFLGPDPAERFAKGFRHAVELCSGKPSAF